MTEEHGAMGSDPVRLPDQPGHPGQAGDPDPTGPTGPLSLADGPRGEHPDIEALDGYLDTHPDGPGGPGSARGITASRLDRHVRSCHTCRENLTALRRVRAELARLASLTMPDEVALRIQAALAASTSTAGSGGGAASAGGPGRPPGTGATSTSSTLGAIGTASVTGLAGGTGAGTAVDEASSDQLPAAGGSTGQTDGPEHRAAPAPRADPSAVPGVARPRRQQAGPGAAGGGRRGSGRRPGTGERPGRWQPGATRRAARDWVSIAAVCVALVAFGAAVLTVRGLSGGGSADLATSSAARPAAPEVHADSEAPRGAGSAAGGSAAEDGATLAASSPGGSVLVADTDAPVDSLDVATHGRQLLAGDVATTRLYWSAAPTGAGGSGPAAASQAASSREAAAPVPLTPSALARLLDTPELRMCYDSLAAQTGGEVIALDRVRFDRQPAIMIMLSVAGQPSIVRLVVLDPRCGTLPMAGAVWHSANMSRAA